METYLLHRQQVKQYGDGGEHFFKILNGALFLLPFCGSRNVDDSAMMKKLGYYFLFWKSVKFLLP